MAILAIGRHGGPCQNKIVFRWWRRRESECYTVLRACKLLISCFARNGRIGQIARSTYISTYMGILLISCSALNAQVLSGPGRLTPTWSRQSSLAEPLNSQLLQTDKGVSDCRSFFRRSSVIHVQQVNPAGYGEHCGRNAIWQSCVVCFETGVEISSFPRKGRDI